MFLLCFCPTRLLLRLSYRAKYFLLLRKNGPTERIWMKFAAGNHCHELINDYILAENGTKTTEQQDIRRISLLPYCPNGF